MKKWLISILLFMTMFFGVFAFAGCGETGGGFTGNDGTYYLYENDTYDKSVYFKLSGGNWTDDDGEKGTYKISGNKITFYYTEEGETFDLCDGTIGNGVLYVMEQYYCKTGYTPNGGNADGETNIGGSAHTHVYDQEIVSEQYLKSAANCESAAVYYKTCECGAKGTGTFEYGDWGNHEPVKGICSVCTLEVGSNGLRYTLSDDETYYSVSKGKCADVDIYIPSMYNNLSVTTIGIRAFLNCDSLTSITIPDSVTTIGEDAFYGCDSLTSVTIGNSVTTIGEDAFRGCYWLTEVYNKSSLEITAGNDTYGYVGYYATHVITEESERGTFTTDDNGYIIYTNGNDKVLVGYTGEETELTLPNDITWVKPYAFYGCSSLTSVTIGNSVTTIGDYAFYCTRLTSVTIGNSVTTIGNEAFEGCRSLTSVTIPDSVTTIGSSAFYNCDNLTSVTIPDSVTTIGDETFRNCISLTNVTIGDSVTTIGGWAFYGCYRLTSITIPDSVTTIGDRAFQGCDGLTSVTIPDSVTTIGNSAFAACDSLTNVTIGDSVTTIGSAAFGYCYRLTEVYNKSSLNIEAGDYYTTHVATKESERGTFATDGKGYIIYTNGNDKVLVGYTGEETELTLPSDIMWIKQCAFSGCSSLTSVTIPDSVTTIGNGAFDGCDSLTSITIPDSVTTIGYEAFEDCSNLTSVTIGNSVATIGNYAFAYCDSLTSITIPDSVTTIGGSAFYYCYGLTSITIPDSVTTIGYGAFNGCGALIIKCEASEKPNGWHSGWNYSGRDLYDLYEVVWGVEI